MILLKFATAINGESTVAAHDKWITISSIQFGVGRGISSVGGGGDRETSNPSFSEVTLTKSMDVASTQLFMQAVAGKSLGKAEIHFLQTGGDKVKGQVYLKIELEEVLVSSYSMSSGGENLLQLRQVRWRQDHQRHAAEVGPREKRILLSAA
jgi:type VI secretion system secreted protein Hcp